MCGKYSKFTQNKKKNASEYKKHTKQSTVCKSEILKNQKKKMYVNYNNIKSRVESTNNPANSDKPPRIQLSRRECKLNFYIH